MIGKLKKKLTADLRSLCLGAAAAVCLLVGLAALQPGHGACAEPPLWPLELSTRYLTSNFMEYRSGRFHAGLDLKTRSQEGFPVLAVEDGWISRVRATPRAYGRAVYLHGRSGKTYVYAHLGRFNDKIRARVEASRGTGGRYEASLYLEPGAVPVRRGEILGISGQSGTGGPHLHFEVRDAAQRPQNPLDHGFAVCDTFAPVFEVIRAIPVTAASTLEGACQGRALTPEGDARISGLQGKLPALRVQGPVAFTAGIVDKSDIRGHRLEPWLLEVHLDGQLVHRCLNESYAFDQNSLQRLEWLIMPGVRERWLHRRPGNVLPGRWGDLWYLGDKGLGLPAGPHEIRVAAWDRTGNQSQVTFSLLVQEGQLADSGSGGALAAWPVDPLEIGPSNLNNEATSTLTPFFENLVEGEVPGSRRLLSPEEGDPVLAPVILWTVPVALDSAVLDRAGSQGLVLSGPAAEFLAADWPIDAAVPVEIPGGATALDQAESSPGAPGLAVYRWHRDGWQYVDDPLVGRPEGGGIRFALGDPGLHAVFRDTLAPSFDRSAESIVLVPGQRGDLPGVTMPRWEIVALGLADAGSGVDPATLSATLDGRPLVVEPDLPRDRVLVELPASLTPGAHSLLLKVADGAKNQASLAVELLCPQ